MDVSLVTLLSENMNSLKISTAPNGKSQKNGNQGILFFSLRVLNYDGLRRVNFNDNDLRSKNFNDDGLRSERRLAIIVIIIVTFLFQRTRKINLIDTDLHYIHPHFFDTLHSI